MERRKARSAWAGPEISISSRRQPKSVSAVLQRARKTNDILEKIRKAIVVWFYVICFGVNWLLSNNSFRNPKRD